MNFTAAQVRKAFAWGAMLALSLLVLSFDNHPGRWDALAVFWMCFGLGAAAVKP